MLVVHGVIARLGGGVKSSAYRTGIDDHGLVKWVASLEQIKLRQRLLEIIVPICMTVFFIRREIWMHLRITPALGLAMGAWIVRQAQVGAIHLILGPLLHLSFSIQAHLAELCIVADPAL